MKAAEKTANSFDINFSDFRRGDKASALSYLIEKIESKNINVCQGVLTNKILPHLNRDVYKNTSGFVIQDDTIPFVFIPSEINPDERDGRQIYTLAYLVALIGLDAYEYVIDKDFKVKLLASKGLEEKIYAIASEFVLPTAITDLYQGVPITTHIRDTLASKYKITPTAVVVILRKRGLITSFKKYRDLLPEKAPAAKKKGGRSQKIEVSVRKFNGKYVFDAVNSAIKSGVMYPVQAQYLLFGCVNKKNFKRYRKSLSI